MKLIIQDRAYKDLKKIDKTQAKIIINEIKRLINYPNISNIKKLKNHTPEYRLRIRNYRILFDIEDDTIIISNIKHRKEAY